MRIPRFIRNYFPGYRIIDFKEWLKKGVIEIYLEKADKGGPRSCCRCGCNLQAKRGKHRMNIKHLPLFNFECHLIFWREKGHCPDCKKARSEKIDFLSQESPHLSKEYSWWIGRLTEIATVTETARLTDNDPNTVWRIDFDRLLKMMQNYEIPNVKRISVDEVYARRKKYFKGENRNQSYFTIVTDLDTRRVIWASNSRDKAALDEFFKIIGKDRCKKIEVVAMDQHDPYKASVKEHCPQAKVVWDRFHVMRSFEDALNDERLELVDKADKGSVIKNKAHGRFKYLFLKKAKKRTAEEVKHLEEVMQENKKFSELEIIKERFFQFFNQRTEDEARDILIEVKTWIKEGGFSFLESWVDNFVRNWDTIKNFFTYRVTSALSEGVNNVIKTIKKRSYGFKNMIYFKLKILQVCGYLNSKYVKIDEY